MSSCVFIPSKGVKLFNALKKQFGYTKGSDLFLRVISPRFINDHKRTLSLDAEGIPSYESVMSNSWVKNFLGEGAILNSLNTFTAKDNTRDNYNLVLEEAYNFNNTSLYKNDYIATVEYTEDGKIIAKVSKRTKELEDKFTDQYGVFRLNNRLAEIFAPLGVTIENLTEAETKAGRIGHIDFSKAKDIASGFKSMIRVANNIEGAEAISEEFSHLLVALFKDETLVKRAYNAIRNNPEVLKTILKEQYEEVYEYHNGNLDLVAEEALGQILQKNLVANSIQTPNQSLFRRAINFIVSKFKYYELNTIDKAIQEANDAMSSLAKRVLTNSLEITQEDIARIQRDDTFNALSKRIERNINILKEATKVEQKRAKISGEDNTYLKDIISKLKKYSKEDADTIQGLAHYATNALNNLSRLYNSFKDIGDLDINKKASLLRLTQQYLQSYASFIKELTSAYNEERTLGDNIFNVELSDGSTLADVLKDLNDLNGKLENEFKTHAVATFTEFIQPYIEGTDLVAAEIIQDPTSDISFMDLWLDSMGTSSDVLLQVFDTAAKKARDNARSKTEATVREIQAWMQKAESLGITSFDWMFEVNSEGKKTGNYISEVNIGEYQYQYDKFIEELNKKYGKNPTGDKAKQKIAERKEWINRNAYVFFNVTSPKSDVWRNKAFDNLTDNQKMLLAEYKRLKGKLDALIPESKRTSNLAIQIRKSRGQRIIDSATSPKTLFDNIKEDFKKDWMDAVDDDQIFGAGVKKGLTNYDGTEFMTLPLTYLSKLENPEELSTDVVGTLMSYAYMCHQYSELENIVNPLEVGRAIVKNYRKPKKTRGGNPLVEKIEIFGDVVYNQIFESEGSNIVKKLDSFMESQIYQRYIKDEGEVLGVNVGKAVNNVLSYSSLAMQGFNWLSNLANLVQGISMQHIETAAQQYFTFSELVSADKEYSKMLTDFIPELGSRVQNSKMALLGRFFNIKQDYDGTIKRSNKKNILERVFGTNIAFIGQNGGDHWLYYRTAIAYMKHTKIKVNGKEMSVWDAIQIKDSGLGDGIKEMYIEDAYNLDGTKFDPHKFGRQIAHINHGLFGIYNQEDANAANRVALGRLLLHFRKWMKPLYNKRFQGKTYNLEMNATEEGYYRTLGRILLELKRGKVQLGMLSEQLTAEEKSNINRALFELAQFFCVWALANLINWPDDKDRPWALKLSEYMAHRMSHELGGLTPTLSMVTETLKTVKTPMASLSWIENITNLVGSVMDPRDYFNEIQSGPYKGLSTLEKNFIKAPLPGIAQYRQIDKFIGELDTSIMYYVRPY